MTHKLRVGFCSQLCQFCKIQLEKDQHTKKLKNKSTFSIKVWGFLTVILQAPAQGSVITILNYLGTQKTYVQK